MKSKLTSFISLLFVFLSCFCLVSCKDEEVAPVAIDLTGVSLAEGTTLLDVMEEFAEEGTLTFSLSNGMITAINGKKNALNYNPCWMLYTTEDDSELVTTVYTYEYDGKVLNQSLKGVGELPVRTGVVYVWVYQEFTF